MDEMPARVNVIIESTMDTFTLAGHRLMKSTVPYNSNTLSWCTLFLFFCFFLVAMVFEFGWLLVDDLPVSGLVWQDVKGQRVCNSGNQREESNTGHQLHQQSGEGKYGYRKGAGGYSEISGTVDTSFISRVGRENMARKGVEWGTVKSLLLC